jgi:hypothetical protein
VPAVDFGPENTREANLPASFASFLFGPLMPGDTNLGNCWVSRKCFAPTLANAGLVEPLLAAFPNLRVFLLTAVTGATPNVALWTGQLTVLVRGAGFVNASGLLCGFDDARAPAAFLAPTLLAAVGIAPPEEMEGVDLGRLGPPATELMHRFDDRPAVAGCHVADDAVDVEQQDGSGAQGGEGRLDW